MDEQAVREGVWIGLGLTSCETCMVRGALPFVFTTTVHFLVASSNVGFAAMVDWSQTLSSMMSVGEFVSCRLT